MFKNKSGNIEKIALMLDGLKAFEDKGLISYDFNKKTATIDKAKFEIILTLAKGTTLNNVAHAAATKIFLEKTSKMTPDEIDNIKEPISVSLLDIDGSLILNYTMK